MTDPLRLSSMSVSQFVFCLVVVGALCSLTVAGQGVCSSSLEVKGKGVKAALCTLQQYLAGRADEGFKALEAIQGDVFETREDIRAAVESMEVAADEVASLREHAMAGMAKMDALQEDVSELKELVGELHRYLMGDESSGVSPGNMSCHEGYEFVGGSCYLLCPSPIGPLDALVYCEAMEGRMASVTSDKDLENLHTFLHGKNITVNVESVEGLTGPQMFEHIRVGTRVVRGTDWEWDQQDGGDGLGTVKRVTTPDEWLRVQWDNGHENSYRMGIEDKYDLKLAFTESLYSIWIPGRRAGDKWMNELEEIQYLKWMPGQPDNADGREDCLQLGYSFADNTLLMNDYSCGDLGNLVCQAEPIERK